MKVFLSYHHTTLDAGLAEFLARELASEFDVFIDRELRVGDDWPREIQKQLEASDAVIVLLSRESVERPILQREVTTAFEISEKRPMEILPVKIAGAEIPIELAQLDRIQYRELATVFEDPAPLATDLAEALREAERRQSLIPKTATATEVEAAARDDGAEKPEDPAIAIYRAWARDRHAGLDLLGLGAGDVQLRLEEVYVPLRIAHCAPRLDLEARAGKRRGELAWELATGDIELESIFTRGGDAGPHAVIFGEPGAGKTTCLKKLHHLCFEEGAVELGLAAGTLPLLLPLRWLRTVDLDSSLPQLLDAYLGDTAGEDLPTGIAERLWRAGRLLLLLDGLDEIASETQRARVATLLETELTAKGAPRTVISCRYSGYGDSVRLGEAFLHLDVRPLDAAQVRRLVRTWFRAAERALPRYTQAEATSAAESLVAALDGAGYSSQQLKVLVGSPLLLTLLCVVVLRGGDMPRQRVAFYDQCLRVLLGKWGKAARHTEPLLEVETALAVLRPLAYALHAAERKDDLHTAEAINHIEKRLAELAVDASPFAVHDWLYRETGVLEEYAPQRYGFLHLGLQEYLAAAHIASRGGEILERLGRDFGEKWWREVVLLLAGLPGHQVLRPFLERVVGSTALLEHADLIRECLTEAPEVDLEPLLALLTEDVEPTRQAAALRLVRGRCDPRILEQAEGLTASPAGDVAALARQLVAECAAATPAVEASPDLFLMHPPEALAPARALAEALRRKGFRLFAEPGSEWPAKLEEMLQRTRGVAVLVGPEGPAPWEQAELRTCLELFARRRRRIVPVLSAGASDFPPLPAELPWATWVDLREGLTDSGCAALESALAAPADPEMDFSLMALEVSMTPEPGHDFPEPITGGHWLWIPGGQFLMGDSKSHRKSEQPAHWVRVSPFWLAKTPVTNKQYGVFLERSDYEEPPTWRDRRFSGEEQPVVGVSWIDAQEYCRWLSKELGFSVGLPSEAQWEFAARGEEGRIYPWGNEEPEPSRACFDLDFEKGKPARVGSFPDGKGPFGNLDMAGNVWEWCRDAWHKETYAERVKTGAETVDPLVRGTDREDVVRVLRGGGWVYPAVYLRAAYRFRSPALGRGGDVGFRVSAAPASS